MTAAGAEFPGFSTAKGKPTSVSAEALAKAARIFGDHICPRTAELQSTATPKPDGTPATPVFQDFTTGNGKAVKISTSALSKAMQMFGPGAPVPDESLQSLAHNGPSPAGPSAGFSTAKGRSVPVSADALARARVLVESDASVAAGPPPTPADIPSFGGFSTGKGRAVAVSEEKLREASRMFAEIDKTTALVPPSPSKKRPLQPSVSTNVPATLPFATPKTDRVAASAKSAPPTAPQTGGKSTPFRIPKRTPMAPHSSLLTPFETPGSSRDACSQISSTSKKSLLVSCLRTTIRAECKTRVPLKDLREIEASLQDLSEEDPLQAVSAVVKNMTFSSASNFAFDHSFSIPADWADMLSMGMTDANHVVVNGEVSIEQLPARCVTPSDIRSVLLSEGCVASHVTDEWVSNHIQQIVWKLASLERRFPLQLAGKCLLPKHVVQRLLHRYNIEFAQGQRSSICRILEGDEPVSRFVTLLICDVSASDTGFCSATVSDGWYTLKARLGKEFESLIHAGNVFSGMKIRTMSMAWDGGHEPCSPLSPQHDSSQVLIHFNSTRRAPKDEKLGFQALHCFKVGGNGLKARAGPVPCIDVIVQRVFPSQFSEKVPVIAPACNMKEHERTEDEDGVKEGETRTVWRTERSEIVYRRSKEQEMAILTEKLRHEETLRLEKEEASSLEGSSPVTSSSFRSLDDGGSIWAALQTAADARSFEFIMTDRQKHLLQYHVQRLQEDKQQNLRRRVARRLSALGMVDMHDRKVSRIVRTVCTTQDGVQAAVSFYNPCQETDALLKEGNCIRLYDMNVSASAPTPVRRTNISDTLYKIRDMSWVEYIDRSSASAMLGLCSFKNKLTAIPTADHSTVGSMQKLYRQRHATRFADIALDQAFAPAKDMDIVAKVLDIDRDEYRISVTLADDSDNRIGYISFYESENRLVQGVQHLENKMIACFMNIHVVHIDRKRGVTIVNFSAKDASIVLDDRRGIPAHLHEQKLALQRVPAEVWANRHRMFLDAVNNRPVIGSLATELEGLGDVNILEGLDD
eukprot:ANDGO_06734.mRNA.1 Protein BREAST CANCER SUSCEPTIBILITY 2 homolog A